MSHRRAAGRNLPPTVGGGQTGPAAAATGGAVARWEALVHARREQMEAQRLRLGPPEPDWWAGRTGMLAHGIGDPFQALPFGVAEIAARLTPGGGLLDVGGGAGRYAVPLLRVAGRVTVLEPSATLAALAREQLERAPAARAGQAAWTVVEQEWPAWRPWEAFEAVLLAHVLYPHADLRGWVSAATAAAGRWVFIVHGTVPDAPGALGRVIEAYHGEPRLRQPGLPDLLPALLELGIEPEVRMGSRRFRRAFDGERWAEQVAHEALIPPEPAELRRIRRLMRPHLEPREDGSVGLAAVDAPVALLGWRTAPAAGT